MLHSGRCEVYGLEDGDTGFVVRDTEDVLISVVGRPAAGAIAYAITREWSEDVVVAQLRNDSYIAEALPGWEAGRATLHLLGDTPRLPRAPAYRVRRSAPWGLIT